MAVKPSGPLLVFVGRFLSTASISVLRIGLFIFFFLVQSRETVHFFTLSIFIGKWLLIDSYDHWCFRGVSCNFYLLTDNFTDLSPVWFFLMSLAKGLSILFIFSKNRLLVSLIFVIILSLFYFCSDLYDFLPSTNFRFCLFFFLWLF